MSFNPEGPQPNPKDDAKPQEIVTPDGGYEIVDADGVIRHARIPLEDGGVIFYDNSLPDEPWEA